MKKTLFAAVALLCLASCAKENTAVEPINPTAPVAATFTSAAITRVANNAWQADDKIGITMVENKTTTLADGSYENVPYTVGAAGESGTFSADSDVIYFPVDGSVVDFIAYYPKSDIDAEKNITVSVANQSDAHIDLVAAKAEARSKASATVAFANDKENAIYEAFSHQLSKLSMTIVAGDGVGSLADMVTTIKGQKTTAKFNIYTFDIDNEDNVDDIDAITTTKTVNATSTTVSEAILLPTAAVAGSTIEFATTDGNVYILDTSNIAFEQGKEYNYTITLKRTGAEISGATINGWGDGTEGEDELTAEPVAPVPTVTELEISNFTHDSYSLTVNAENAERVYIYETDSMDNDITADEIRSGVTKTIEASQFGVTQDNLSWDDYSLYIYAVAEDSDGKLSEISEEITGII